MRSIDTMMAEGKTKPRRSSKDRNDPQRITIETSAHVVAMLDDLVASGLYRATRGEVAEELLREKLREIEKGSRP